MYVRFGVKVSRTCDRNEVRWISSCRRSSKRRYEWLRDLISEMPETPDGEMKAIVLTLERLTMMCVLSRAMACTHIHRTKYKMTS